MLRISRVAGGNRNVTLHITGVLTEGDMPLEAVNLGDSSLKISSLIWLIQEKVGIYLWWDAKTLILPMESRNAVRFDTSLRPPEGWNGTVWLSSFGFAEPQKAFFLVMDLDR